MKTIQEIEKACDDAIAQAREARTYAIDQADNAYWHVVGLAWKAREEAIALLQ